MDGEWLKDQLAGLPIAALRAYDVIGSTNDEALRWCAQGAQDGSLVIADEQTNGRGRFNRRWVTRPGVSLALSMIFQPKAAEREHLALFSPLAALSICQALEESLRLQPSIKWPNDVLLGGRKAAGILVEAAWLGEQLQGIVVGMGINIAAEAVPPDDLVFFPATSVEAALGRPVDRFALLRSVLEALLAWRVRLGSPAFFDAWQDRLAFRGQWVTLSPDGQSAPGEEVCIGLLLGIDARGDLLLRLESGEEKTFSVGDIHLRPAGRT